MLRVLPLIFICLSGVGLAVFEARFASNALEVSSLEFASDVSAEAIE